MDMKFELGKRLRAPITVRMVDEKVASKSEQASNAIRLAILDRRVQGIRTYPAVSAGPECRALEIDTFGALFCRQKFAAGDVTYRWPRELNVAARRIEAAGQGHQRRYGAIGLRRVGMLAHARPHVVTDGASLEQQSRRFRHLPGRHPRHGFDPIRRIIVTQITVEAEGRTAAYGLTGRR